MFAEMRAALGGIPRTTDILEHVYSLPTAGGARERGMEAIRSVERRAMALQRAQPGLAELMAHLEVRGLRKAICTRNFDAPVSHLLTAFLPGKVFHPVVTRDFRPPKPDPAGILFIARSWGLVRKLDAEEGQAKEGREKQQQLVEAAHEGSEPETRGALGPSTESGSTERGEAEQEEVGDASALIMVGDSLDDMTAGRRAGAATVLLANDENSHLADHAHTDLVIHRLDELIAVLDDGFVGRPREES